MYYEVIKSHIYHAVFKDLCDIFHNTSMSFTLRYWHLELIVEECVQNIIHYYIKYPFSHCVLFIMLPAAGFSFV